MQEKFDVAVIGGAFSGAATALLLRRDAPELSVAIIERSAHFDRKVGEATTEVSGCFLTKRLALTHHLCHHHVVKNGLRFWFSHAPEDEFDRCGEIGAFYQVRLPSYQVDREVLDEHVLTLACEAGAQLFRPAKLTSFELSDSGFSELTVRENCGERKLSARWVIDASGRAALLARRLGVLRSLPEHPTNAIWARFRNVKDWDGYDLLKRFPLYARSCQVSRASATNHLTGYGWWCWIIPLRGGDFSAGLVYDSRLYTPPERARLGDRLKAHLLTHPVGREILGKQSTFEATSKPTRCCLTMPSGLPDLAGRSSETPPPSWTHSTVKVWIIVHGPFRSRWTASCEKARVRVAISRILMRASGDRPVAGSRPCTKDKYHYLGDKELMTAAFLMDLGLFFFGPVRSVVRCPKAGFSQFPFEGSFDGMVVRRLMAFYNRRLVRIAQKRHAAGVYGPMNLDSRTLLKGFEPTRHVWKLILRGVRTWLCAELRSLPLRRVQAPPLACPAPSL